MSAYIRRLAWLKENPPLQQRPVRHDAAKQTDGAKQSTTGFCGLYFVNGIPQRDKTTSPSRNDT